MAQKHVLMPGWSTSPLFDTYARPWGGLPALGDDVPDDARLLIEIARQILAKKRRDAGGTELKADFGIIGEEAPNAFAGMGQDNHHFFGLNMGTLWLGLYLSVELFAMRAPGWGSLAETNEDHLPPLELAPTEAQMDEYLSKNSKIVRALPRKRFRAATMFRHLLLLLSVFHEFHHVVFGHCAYAIHAEGRTRLYEVGHSNEQVTQRQVFHDMEYIADFGAIDLMLWYVNKGTVLNRHSWGRLSVYDLHKLLIYAVGVHCASWHAYNARLGSDALHPDPSARMLNMTAFHSHTLCQSFGEDIALRKIVRPAFVDLALLATACPQLADALRDVQQASVDELHARAMGNMFQSTKELIRPFEYAEA